APALHSGLVVEHELVNNVVVRLAAPVGPDERYGLGGRPQSLPGRRRPVAPGQHLTLERLDVEAGPALGQPDGRCHAGSSPAARAKARNSRGMSGPIGW